MSTLDETIQQTQQLAKQQDAAFAAATPPLAPASKRLSMSIPIGTPVLDLVTGLKGVVIDGKRENVILPPATKPGS